VNSSRLRAMWALAGARKIERGTGRGGAAKGVERLNTFRAYYQTNFIALETQYIGAAVLVSVPITVPVAPAPLEHL
jgi:hypothetical protein